MLSLASLSVLSSKACICWSISMMEMIFFILSLLSLLWLYLMNFEAGSLAFSGSQTGDGAFCLGKRLLQRWT